jgi:hypothetical protein
MSCDVLKDLQQVVNDLLVEAEGADRARLEAVHTQLGKAIDETVS